MYQCSNCSYQSAGYLGKCPNCGEWNTFQALSSGPGGGKGSTSGAEPLSMTALKDVTSNRRKRMKTALHEFDRVLGGGFVPGEAALLTGEPGVGKSTLLLQGLQHLRTLYISGEEGAEQIKDRAERLGVNTENFTFSNTLQLEGVMEGVREYKERFDIVVIDSIQTLYSNKIEGQPGSVTQLREITYGLVQVCKETKVPMIIIGHVTKGGDVAGPKTLEHIVDAVLSFEGERVSQYRILRAAKNRFGSTDEIGIFEMKSEGLSEIGESFAFFENDHGSVPGKAVAGIVEGKRPLFFEVQTLVVPTSLAMPRRVVNGVDYNKLLLLLAVMRKHLSLQFDKYDIYVNVVGGLDVKSPAADLCITAALISSMKNVPVSTDTVFVGEVGLLGEVRAIGQQGKVIQEAKRLGFKNVLSPQNVKNVRDILRQIARE